MGRPLNPLPRGQRGTAAPAPDDVSRALADIHAPLVRLLLSSGIDFTRLAAELKRVFVEQARAELLRTGLRDSDSAISLLSGVHRKDVREWRRNGLHARIAREVPLASQVFARWLHEPMYLDRRRRPRDLPRTGPAPSFESLARAVTQDVHPFTVLGELLRLGLVEVEQRGGVEVVVPHSEGFVPAAGSRELCELFAANVADHASAAVENLLGHARRLEQSVFADGLTQDSVDALATLARRLWAESRQAMLAEAIRLFEADRGRDDAVHRMRFGSYFWDEDTHDAHGREADARVITHTPNDDNTEPGPATRAPDQGETNETA